MCAPSGRTLSQNDWPETTQKLIPSPRLQVMWQSSSRGFPYSAAPTWTPLLNKFSCFVSTCVSLDNSFPSIREEPTFRTWKVLPAILSQLHVILLRISCAQTWLWLVVALCCCSITKSCPTLCSLMDCSTPGCSVLHYLLEFVKIYVHWVSDAI